MPLYVFLQSKNKANEQTELLEMRSAFSILICPFSITNLVNNISHLFRMRSHDASHFLFNQLP